VTCVGSRVRLVGVFISFEKNFYRLPFTPPPPSLVLRIGPSLGKNQYSQARPDYRHGWGSEETGDVDQSRLGRRLLLRLCGRCLFSSSSSRFCAPLSNRGLVLHLRQELFYSGGWATTTPSCLPTVSQPPSSPCSTGSEGGISCKKGNFIDNTQTRDISTRLPSSRWPLVQYFLFTKSQSLSVSNWYC
jgi:hypothetical protein